MINIKVHTSNNNKAISIQISFFINWQSYRHQQLQIRYPKNSKTYLLISFPDYIAVTRRHITCAISLSFAGITCKISIINLFGLNKRKIKYNYLKIFPTWNVGQVTTSQYLKFKEWEEWIYNHEIHNYSN